MSGSISENDGDNDVLSKPTVYNDDGKSYPDHEYTIG